MSPDPVSNGNYDLTKLHGIPQNLSVKDQTGILLKAFESPDPDQRHAAVKRLEQLWKNHPEHFFVKRIEDKTLKLFKKEKNPAVLSALIEFFVKHQVKKAVPFLIEKALNSSSTRPIITASIYGVSKLAENGGKIYIPDLQRLYKKYPSVNLAVTLLKLGDPYPYFEKYAKEDLEVFNEEDTRMVYTDPYWVVMLGLGKSFKTKIIPTVASRMKPEIKNHISLMLDSLAGKKDKRAIPFLLALINLPRHPFSPEKIEAVFSRVVTPESLPLLFSHLKDEANAHKESSKLILSYLGKQHFKPHLEASTRKHIIQTIGECLKNKNYRIRLAAAKILGEIKDKAGSPYLLKALQAKEDYSNVKAAVILALGKIGETKAVPFLKETLRTETNSTIIVPALMALNKLGALEDSLLVKMLESDKYDFTVKDYAALALAKRGKRNGLNRLLNTLFAALEFGQSRFSKEELVDIHRTVRKIIRPGDAHLIRKLLLSASKPSSIIFALEFFRIFKDERNIPLILAKLKSPNMRIRLNALIALVASRKIDDMETLKIIEREKKSLQKYVQRIEKKHREAASSAAGMLDKNLSRWTRIVPSAEGLARIAFQKDDTDYLLAVKTIPLLENYIRGVYAFLYQKARSSFFGPATY